jgi:AcrR family transcriptional regulator
LQPAITDALTEAAVAELTERGYAKLSMEGVARRAEVGKSALYRRWASKDAMVVDVLGQFSVMTGPTEGTGSLAGDIRYNLQVAFEWLTDARIRTILPDLLAESRRNQTLAKAADDAIANPRLAWGRAVLAHAQERGEVTPAQIELLLVLFAAAVHWRLVHDRPVDPGYLDQLTDLLVNGVTGVR